MNGRQLVAHVQQRLAWLRKQDLDRGDEPMPRLVNVWSNDLGRLTLMAEWALANGFREPSLSDPRQLELPFGDSNE